ncbi:Poli [Symbiodinium natans]|uniref:Poli protein n=1 Tax=Symbiodinium natans TaxID=878477 RepID=A0A812ULF8_9DINO|nr:Poli [Symbiodinium natans]
MTIGAEALGERKWVNILTSQMIPDSCEKGKFQKPALASRAAASSPGLLAASRFVLAIDMDCFYAQCEEIRHPHLKGKPVGVQQKMLVITSNYAARAFGIKKGDSLQVVRDKCPEITICNGEDLTFYGELSQRVFDVAARWSSTVEKLGLDEVFVDVTELITERLKALEDPTARLRFAAAAHEFPEELEEEREIVQEIQHGDWKGLDDRGRCWVQLIIAASICREIREAIFSEVGLTSSAGISVSKQLAKMVSSWKKPSRQTLFLPTADRLAHLLPDDLAVQKIPGIGFASTQKLHELGIRTIGEIVSAIDACGAHYQRLLTEFDVGTLRTMRAICMGIDKSLVKASGAPKTCSVQDSFWQGPVCTEEQVRENLLALAQKLITKVRSDERMYGYRPIPTFSLSLMHAPSSEAGAARRGRKQIQLGSFQIARRPEEQGDDARLQGQLADRAFTLFRKLVPKHEPFVLHILNLQVGFGEALGAQRRLSFAAPSTAPVSPALGPQGLERSQEIHELSDSDDVEKTRHAMANPPSAVVDADALASLLNMGFGEERARQALVKCGDVAQAIEMLLVGPTGCPAHPGRDSSPADKRRRLNCSMGEGNGAIIDLRD